MPRCETVQLRKLLVQRMYICHVHTHIITFLWPLSHSPEYDLAGCSSHWQEVQFCVMCAEAEYMYSTRTFLDWIMTHAISHLPTDTKSIFQGFLFTIKFQSKNHTHARFYFADDGQI